MRSSGILMHISSLPSRYGIGTLGEEALKFVDFLKDSGQEYWQVLPVGPTSYGDSPYQSFSTFAGNPYFIDLELLCGEGLLTAEECEAFPWGEKEDETDYGLLYQNRFQVLKKAYDRFCERTQDAYLEYCRENREWLDDYALFMTLKDLHQGKPWYEWREELKSRDIRAMEQIRIMYAKEIDFWKMTQYLFAKQWKAVKQYAAQKGIRIIGDIPIYVSMDSADVWAEPELFELDEDLKPVNVAGCPPDAFTADGQLWGNPLFKWDVMEQDGFSWWLRRVKHLSELFDVIRIDHFRGFESYYAIPAGDENAKNGQWKKGPGLKLFNTLEEKLGKLHIIVEDLGFLTPEVLQMVKDSGYPGMKLLQFAFDGGNDNIYLPHNHIKNSVVYTGSHDNDTILGWALHAPAHALQYAVEYLRLDQREGYNWGMMKAAWASVSELSVVTMQDLLDLGSEARMNTPSTTGGNWKWRMKKGVYNRGLSEKLRHMMYVYGRLR